VHLGAWDLTGVSAGFEYLLQISTTDRKAGRVLSGWPADGGGLSPRLSAMDKYDKANVCFDGKFHGILNNLIDELFGVHAAAGALDRAVVELLFATVLLHWRAFIRTYGADTLLASYIHQAAKSYGISPQQLCGIADVVRADFLQRNAQYLSVGQLADEGGGCLIDAKTVASALTSLADQLRAVNGRLANIERAAVPANPTVFYTDFARKPPVLYILLS